MLDPITTAFIIKTFLAVLVFAFLVYLGANVVRNYIRERLTTQDVNAKPIVMMDKLSNGDYSVATGFLEGNTTIVDSRVWHAQRLDEELLKFPEGKPVIVNS